MFLGVNLNSASQPDIQPSGKIILSVIVVVYFWSAMCSQIQRLHDRNKSGWWFWIGVIPVIGEIYLLAESGFRRGTEGPNRFGPDPLVEK